jgi:hypothetical protein
MALTIEDGSEVAGADSFITLGEYADEQVKLFGDALTGSDPVQEAAIRRAWYYLKSLSWRVNHLADEAETPVTYPTFGGTIPADIKTAQAILARFEQATPNGLQPNVTPGQMKVLTQVGEISWTAANIGGIQGQRAVVMMAADLLKPFVNETGSTRFLLRA